ncbi:PAAR-like protein [Bergeyella zoohelcum]|uniref:LysM domain-containing protein n=1 Tax=Bergeyella zoohelcum TaxID=1015 RepID=A0A380ZW67_9FLAO|nr:PAAR-like protein [Bergeyella zoohelcum]SUV53255.1 Uncharacterised protein [Bergeyella zoohelcum]
MKHYITQSGDTLASVARKFGVKDEHFLRTYHNLHCSSMSEVIRGEVSRGTKIMIPEDPQYLQDNPSDREISMEDGEGVNSVEGVKQNSSYSVSASQVSQKEQPKQSKAGDSSEHDGKYFVIQRGKAECNQGVSFPTFKVSSHQKHYWNDADGQADYLAVTEDDVQFTPSVQPFGAQCKLQPTSGGYLPCSYAPAGKWTSCYEKVKVLGKSCVTEASELQCAIGGKITVKSHGQQSEIGKSHIMNADSQEQWIYNPIVDLDELKKMLNEDFSDDYE